MQSKWCHAPNRFGTVNTEDNVYIKWSWCEGWARRSLIVAIYHTRRLSWCKRQLPTSSSHHSHKNHQEAEETEGITSIMVWERNAIYYSPTPIPERAKKLKNWWRNKAKKRRNDVSAQMSFLGAVTTMSNSGPYPVTRSHRSSTAQLRSHIAYSGHGRADIPPLSTTLGLIPVQSLLYLAVYPALTWVLRVLDISHTL